MFVKSSRRPINLIFVVFNFVTLIVRTLNYTCGRNFRGF